MAVFKDDKKFHLNKPPKKDLYYYMSIWGFFQLLGEKNQRTKGGGKKSKMTELYTSEEDAQNGREEERERSASYVASSELSDMNWTRRKGNFGEDHSGV